MKRQTLCLAAAALAIWSVRGGAQTPGAPAAFEAPSRQIDIGAAQVPLNDNQRADLDQAVRKHSYSAEKAVIDKARAEHPESADLLVMWGRLAYLEKQPKDAVDALERADKIKAISEPDRLTLAIAYEFSGKPAQARAEFLKLIKMAPSNAQYLYLLGRIEEADRVHLEDAGNSFARAVRADPNFVRAYDALGQTQEAMGRPKEARKTYEMGAAVNRRQSVRWEWSPLDLGILLLKEGDVAGAEKLCREALQYNPRSAWGHYYLGQVFHKQGRDADATAEYKAALFDNPKLREAWLALGRDLKRQGNDAEGDRALEMFKKLEDQENAARGKKN